MGFDMHSQQTDDLRQTADGLLAATNDFDTERALKLFTPDAVIDDPSTGHRFDGHAGIRTYIEQYFIGYHTVSRLLSIKRLGPRSARVRVDFSGDFGHEFGLLEISVDSKGLIVRIDANLE
jgi:ketosteroid isomerase-like protein